VATNWVHGLLPEAAAPDGVDGTPRDVLRRVLLPLLVEAPCYVSFSGGRDSSAVLAVATAIARAEGLDDPIPVTERYPHLPEADEEGWQRAVVDHIGCRHWLQLDRRHDNDLVGEAATAGLRRWGLLWPATVQVKPTLLEAVAGGFLLTGEGGDELFGPRRVAYWAHLRRDTSIARRVAVRGAAASTLPAAVRRWREAASLRAQQLQPWLRPATAERHIALLAADQSREPLRWPQSLSWLLRRRGSELGTRNFRLVGAELGVKVVDPLLDPRFVAAFGRSGGWAGYPGRTAAMRALFADVLPAAVLQRTSKAMFNRAFMGEPTRRFARSWDGSGVDATAVDPDRLRAEWLSNRPSALSGLLLQAAWLETQGTA